jgi:hypothetical protein
MIISKPQSKAYSDSWDRIFKKEGYMHKSIFNPEMHNEFFKPNPLEQFYQGEGYYRRAGQNERIHTTRCTIENVQIDKVLSFWESVSMDAREIFKQILQMAKKALEKLRPRHERQA